MRNGEEQSVGSVNVEIVYQCADVCGLAGNKWRFSQKFGEWTHLLRGIDWLVISIDLTVVEELVD